MTNEQRCGLIGSAIIRPFSSKKALINWGTFLLLPYMAWIMQVMFEGEQSTSENSIQQNFDSLIHPILHGFSLLREHALWFYLGLIGFAIFISLLCLKEQAMAWATEDETLKQQLEILQEKEFLQEMVPKSLNINQKKRL